MIYSGDVLTADFVAPPGSTEVGAGVVAINFDAKDASVNTLGMDVLKSLDAAVTAIEGKKGVVGLVFTSGKDSFIVGANIHEFVGFFAAEHDDIVKFLDEINALFNRIEDLPFPTTAAINGLTLGGGCELVLACDYRVMSPTAKIGLPEVKLGIHPGWGGTVRLPRLIGLDNANEWICGGGNNSAETALEVHAVDAVVADDQLLSACLDIIAQANAGALDYQARRQEKTTPVKHQPIELMMAFESAMGVIKGKAGPHYPAPVAVLKAMQKSVTKDREKALAIEADTFAKMAKTDVCKALISIFQKDTYVKKIAKQYAADANDIGKSAVLGAGIMGGGIAYQSASKGTPIVMKDINQAALDLGLSEAQNLLGKQLKREKITPEQMGQTIAAITPTLSYGDFNHVDVIIEAVVENENIKKSVLAETEASAKPGTILASNTSTISIDALASALKNPENFCGMHFFNPVHRMPLVEVIRGEKSSDAAIGTTVAYAQKMGKTPIVVNDCPGFLVNRVLFPYFGGFSKVIEGGADFRHVDKVMERFGWPMGPAYLLDVVGMDTAYHADAVMAAGFPDRMSHDGESPIDRLYAKERYGQKNKVGFYQYETDRKGKLKKLPSDDIDVVLAGVIGAPKDFEDQEIIDRLMIPLCIEVVRCLEEGIVASPAEADLALIYGIGFPPFLGGALHYIDQIGLQAFCDKADQYKDLGGLYYVTDKMREMAAAGSCYYDQPINENH